MLIEGNAESIYFARDSGKMTISGMQRSLSSKIRADFKDNKVTNMGFYTKPENKYGPLNKFTEDDKILKGFIWKPKDRPVSKESIIPSFNKKKKKAAAAAAEKAAKAKLADKSAGKKGTGDKAVKDSTQKAAPGKQPALKTGKDGAVKPSGIKAAKDSIIKTGPASLPPGNIWNSDTPLNLPAKLPVVKAAGDTTKTLPPKGKPVE